MKNDMTTCGRGLDGVRKGWAIFALLATVFIGLSPAAKAMTNGDVAIVFVNATTTSGGDSFGFVALTNIPASEVIVFTDNGWTNSPRAFSRTEGWIRWTSPGGGLSAGSVVVVTNMDAGTLTVSAGTAARSSNPNFTVTDSLIAHQSNVASGVWNLFGIKFTTAWDAGALGGTTASQLPTEISSNQLVVGNACSRYNRTLTNGTKDELMAAITNSANWSTSASSQPLTNLPFTVNNPVVAGVEIAVSGNGANIADGDTTPSTSDHTDFGSVGVMGSTLVRTYTITNSGSATLNLGSVSISGAQATNFTVSTSPSATVSANGSTTLGITFDPSAVGTHAASVSFSTDDSDENPFNFDIQGTGAGAGISNSPTSLSFTATVGGGNPATQTIGFTNVGLGTLSYSITSNASWISATPVSGTLAAGAGQQVTVSVDITGLQAGTSNATLTISDPDATNSPKTVAVALTLNASLTPPTVTTDPVTGIGTTSATAGGNVTADGGASVTERGVVYNTSGNPSTSDTKLTSGSGVGTFTAGMSSLVPGQTYYVKAYAINSQGTAYGSEESFSASCFGSAVTGLYANPTNGNSFTAIWSAMAAATGYRLDVSTNATLDGAVGAQTTIFRETMGNPGGTVSIASHESGNGFDNDSFTMGSGSAANPADMRVTSASSIYSDPTNNVASGLGNVFFSSTLGDYGFSIAGIDASGYSNLRLSYGYRKESGSANATYSVEWSTNSGSSWNTITISNAPAANASVAWYMISNLTLSASARSANLSLRWVKTGTASMRIDDILLQGQPSVGADFVPGYSNRAVAATSQSVTGLAEGVAYYYRVRAEGAGSCVSPDSTTATVTTLTVTPQVSFTNATATASEGAGSVGGTVKLAFPADCTIQVALASSTATSGADFTLAATQLVFSISGSTEQDITFNLIDDSLVEISETATVQMVAAYGANRTSATNFTVTITDNEPSVQLTAASASVTEVGGVYTVMVYKSSTLNNVSGQLAIGGAASAASDYTVTTTNFTLNGATTSATIEVTATDDAFVEGDELATFTVVNLAGASTGTPATLSLTISDDDCGDGGILFQGFEQTTCDRWPIAAGSGFISTSSGATDTPINQRIRTGTRSWQPTANGTRTLDLSSTSVAGYNSMTVSVRFTSTGSSGIQGADPSDYIEIYVATNGAAFPATADVRVSGSAANNSLWGYDATLSVSTIAGTPVSVASAQTGSSLNNYSLANITLPNGSTSVALRVIAVNNNAGEFWNVDDIVIAGNTGTVAVVSFSATGAASQVESSGPVTVDVGIAPAATGIVDIVSVGSAVLGSDFTLSATQLNFSVASSTQTVTITMINDGVGEVAKTVSLNLANPGGLFLASPTNFAFALVDDDVNFARWEASSLPAAAEGDAAININVELTSAIDATVQVASVGSALLDTDFTLSTTNVVFTSGGGTSQVVTVTLTDDEALESAETISLNLVAFLGMQPGTPTNVVFTLNDNEPSVSLAEATASVNESAGTYDVIINKSAERNTVTGELLLSGTAASGSDYTIAATNFTLSGATTTTTITVTLTDDALVEATETMVASLRAISAASTGAVAQVTLSILDDDCVTNTIAWQGFESSGCDTWPITEGAAFISSVGTTANDSPANSRIRFGQYSWQGSSLSRTLQLDHISIQGYSAVTVSVRVASISTNGSNGADSGDSVNIFVSTNGAAFPGTADLRIVGNSNARWSYSATQTVTATVGTPVLATAPQGNSSSNNYSLANLIIPNGVTSIALRVVTVNDISTEVWAIDDIQVSGSTNVINFVGFSTGSDTTSEGDPDLSVSVNLSSSADATVQVHSVGTALIGTDFSLSATSIVFTAGGPTSQVLTVSVIDDLFPESQEFISLNLTNAAGTLIGTFTNYLVTVNDNEPSVSFTGSTVAVSEDVGTYTVTLIRTTTNNTVTVELLRSGSATLTSDYTISATNVTFSGNSLTQTVTVTVVDDASLETSETIILLLNNITGARTGSPASLTFTISDNETSPPLYAGDIALIGVDDGSDAFSIAALTNLYAGQVIYFTDNGWDGSAFRGSTATDGDGGENLLKLTINGTVTNGTIIRTTDTSSLWTWTTSGAIPGTSAGSFALLQLAGAADQIYAFQGPVNNPLNSPTNHLFVIDDTLGFEAATSSANGGIPTGLSSNANTALSFNFSSATVYSLDMSRAGALTMTTKAEWLTYIGISSNWVTGGSIPSGTLNFNLSCDSGRRPVFQTLTDKSGFVGSSLSFTVTASDPTCIGPTINVTALPSFATFTSTYVGSNRVGTFTWTPAFSQIGTHLVRFTATDGTLSTDRVIRIYVGDTGESTNSAGIPVSQTNWAVSITNIYASSSGNVTLAWEAVNGILYDVYYSDSSYGDSMSWNRVVAGSEAGSDSLTAVLNAGAARRFFQVVPAGASASLNGVWGVMRPTVPAGLSMLSAPIDSDRDFNGDLGAELASQLAVGSVAWIMAPGTSPTWTELTLNGSGQWVLTSGANVTTLAQGQGFYIQNAGSSVTPRFTGPIGNDGSGANTLQVGYNIIGLSEGKDLSASTAFESASPISSFNEETGDQIVIQDSDGSWRRLLRRNGVWYDTNTRATTTLTLTPGQAYYYIRRTSSTTVSF